ncbi:hypothetical protein COV23_01840 [Candidatus Wolfebacteria bacterium CG10_big_fil_rev_8_21_14_0_10_31_9]|uniref:Uncharacterized protein n=1 Tax=Candidatus Wolfebacteria bacterium CG10_big_fil_rev_8_21_14_0_10_31_9 TaxID=1975070 RepID=A0A2H0RE46_9BACT|nr:MAG: hypothetical protein COV23_01840 [Candidatus Wolfebacteria bacterium CG10_big_fil_rev_8_21_14_0_10_31_9]
MNTPLIKKLIIVAVVIAIGGILFAYSMKNSPTNTPIETSTSTDSIATTTSSSTESKTPPTYKPQPQIQKISRDQAYKTFSQKGLYIQLIDCVGYPSSLIIKQGTNFMIENKSDLLSSIVIKSQTVLLPTKSFIIISAKDLGFYKILCNGKNALQLQVSP